MKPAKLWGYYLVAGHNIPLGEEVFLGRCGEISCIQQVREDNIARGLPIDAGLDGASIVTIQVRETESVKTLVVSQFEIFFL